MRPAPAFSDDEVVQYVDELLPPQRAAAITARMKEDPVLAERVAALDRQTDRLKGLGAAIVAEPVPERLLAVIHRKQGEQAEHSEPAQEQPAAPQATTAGYRARGQPRSAHRLWPRPVEAAAVLMVLLVGMGIGWYGGRMMYRPADDGLARSLAQAYRFYTLDQPYPVGFTPEHSDEFGNWIEHLFGRRLELPDLSVRGLLYRGGSVLPALNNQVAILLYATKAEGKPTSVAVFIWPSGKAPPQQLRSAMIDGTGLRIGSADGINIAILAPAEDKMLDTIAGDVWPYFAPQEKTRGSSAS